jgi:transcriptional regulator with XRE-family HTH domain
MTSEVMAFGREQPYRLSSMNENESVGTLIRAWRNSRGKSQLSLSIEAGISSRHLSFIETGRSSPSREMVLTLAETLDVPLRDRNALLEAAGFAAAYRETPLEAPTMREVRGALERVLAASEPNPTLVVNRRYDVLMCNQGAVRLMAYFCPSPPTLPANLVRLLVSPSGLRASIQNWNEVAVYVAQRISRELANIRNRDAADDAVLAELTAEPSLRVPSKVPPRSNVFLPVKLQRGSVSMDLFTMITTLGTPLDITLQELRIETLFFADQASRDAFGRIE